MKTKLLISTTVLALFLGMNPAYATDTAEPPATATDISDAPAPEMSVPAQQPGNKLSAGMNIPIDGSSVETFEKSLAAIKGQSTEAEYKTLSGAIDRLALYDLSIRRDRTKLAESLNGMTGAEIIDSVENSRSGRRR